MAWLVRQRPGRRKIERLETWKFGEEACGQTFRNEYENVKSFESIICYSSEIAYHRKDTTE